LVVVAGSHSIVGRLFAFDPVAEQFRSVGNEPQEPAFKLQAAPFLLDWRGTGLPSVLVPTD